MADATQIRITALDQTTAAFRSVQSNISKMTSTLRSVAGPLAAAFSVAAITNFSREILNAADNLAKLSQKTGVSVEDLSSFQLAADLAGVSSDQFATAMVRLNRTISDATAGGQQQIDTFKALGITQDELRRLSPAQVLERIADSFSVATDGADKTAIAMELLGRSGADLIPLLNGGSQALRQFGSTINTEFAKNAEVFNDNLRVMQENLRRFTVSVLGPAIREINKIFGTPTGQDLEKSIERAEQRVKAYNDQIREQLKLTPEIKANSFGFRGLLEAASKAQDELKKLQDARQAALAPPVAPKVSLVAPRRGSAEQKDQKEQTQTLAVYNDTLKLLDRTLSNIETPAQRYYQQLRDLKEIQDLLFPDEIAERLMQINEEFENSQPKIELNNTALKQYRATIGTVQDALQNVAVRGLQNLEDALVGVYSGTLSVKDAFKQMAVSIIQDLIRIQVQRNITGPLSAALDTFFGFGSQGPAPQTDISIPYGGARAMGGTAMGGNAYMVGERGPELFVPGRTGTVVPNNQLGGSGAVVNQTINISTGVSQTVRAEVIGLMPQIMESTKAAVLDAKRRGGAFGKAFA